MGTSATPPDDPRGGPALAAVVLLAMAVRLFALDQPLVENYVGRQIPTAMVARNLERGSGFLAPSLDVAPFPNHFLVEPPVFASLVVAWRGLTGWSLGVSGRFVSGLGVALACWGLFGLVARRSGRASGLAAAAALATFPITLRYGRAFQPDALMLGCLVAGLSGWDAYEWGRGRAWLAFGFVLLSTGLALKVLSAYVLVPLLAVIVRERKPWKLATGVLTLTPAVLWYAHASAVLGTGGGSRASADNGTLWLHALGPAALWREGTARHVVRFLGVRAFTPLGLPLALYGILASPGGRRLWLVWGLSALAAMAAVSGKLHHEYYWLSLAPVVAAGVGCGLVVLAGRGTVGRLSAVALALGLIGLDATFSASTWRTPPEWRSLEDAAAAVRAVVPEDAWVAAPEALLYASDRRGCRIEWTQASARRAAGEWVGRGGSAVGDVDGPVALVEFYRRQGARYFADVAPAGAEPSRLALHDAVRRRYKIVVDRPGVLVAALDDPDHGATPPHDPHP